jgi:hypothetical protein
MVALRELEVFRNESADSKTKYNASNIGSTGVSVGREYLQPFNYT